ncbi:hypothetical protein EV363DRAFT_1106891, partial [Boletus edulis]
MGHANISTANVSILHLHTLLGWCDDMLKDESKLRTSPKNYHYCVFKEEIIDHINITKHHYDSYIHLSHHTSFKDALKYGFYKFQNVHGWYHEVIADVRMHADLALGLHYTPPNTSGSFLHESQSIQLMHWPGPGCTADCTLIETSAYMQTPKSKPDSLSFDPKLPKSVWVYMAMRFHSPSGKRHVQVVREAY